MLGIIVIAALRLVLAETVEISALVIAAVSLYISVKTYRDAQASSEKQQAALDASRHSLESVVRTAIAQESLLKDNLELLRQSYDTSKTQLAVIQAQMKREEERLARRARFEILSMNRSTLKEIEAHDYKLLIPRRQDGWIRLAFLCRNSGTSTLVDPIYLFLATPPTVFVDAPEDRTDRPNRNQLQLGGLNIPPFGQGGRDYTIAVDVKVPVEVPSFDLTLKIMAENMDVDGVKEPTLHFTMNE
jgi:hypothetical protein